MFIEPKRAELPSSQKGAHSAIHREQAIKLVNALLTERGQWFAIWKADISNLKNADSARMASLHFIKSKAMKEILDIQGLEIEHASRKRDGILTAYARIK